MKPQIHNIAKERIAFTPGRECFCFFLRVPKVPKNKQLETFEAAVRKKLRYDFKGYITRFWIVQTTPAHYEILVGQIREDTIQALLKEDPNITTILPPALGIFGAYQESPSNTIWLEWDPTHPHIAVLGKNGHFYRQMPPNPQEIALTLQGAIEKYALSTPTRIMISGDWPDALKAELSELLKLPTESYQAGTYLASERGLKHILKGKALKYFNFIPDSQWKRRVLERKFVKYVACTVTLIALLGASHFLADGYLDKEQENLTALLAQSGSLRLSIEKESQRRAALLAEVAPMRHNTHWTSLLVALNDAARGFEALQLNFIGQDLDRIQKNQTPDPWNPFQFEADNSQPATNPENFILRGTVQNVHSASDPAHHRTLQNFHAFVDLLEQSPDFGSLQAIDFNTQDPKKLTFTLNFEGRPSS